MLTKVGQEGATQEGLGQEGYILPVHHTGLGVAAVDSLAKTNLARPMWLRTWGPERRTAYNLWAQECGAGGEHIPVKSGLHLLTAAPGLTAPTHKRRGRVSYVK